MVSLTTTNLFSILPIWVPAPHHVFSIQWHTQPLLHIPLQPVGRNLHIKSAKWKCLWRPFFISHIHMLLYNSIPPYNPLLFLESNKVSLTFSLPSKADSQGADLPRASVLLFQSRVTVEDSKGHQRQHKDITCTDLPKCCTEKCRSWLLADFWWRGDFLNGPKRVNKIHGNVLLGQWVLIRSLVCTNIQIHYCPRETNNRS